MTVLTLTILERGTLRVKDVADCYDWEVKMDYINNDKSSFTITGPIIAQKGDFVFAKLPNGKYSRPVANGKIRPFYFGIVDTNETEEDESKVEAVSIYNLVNFDFPATSKTGSSVQSHMMKLLMLWLFGDVSKKTDFISVRTEGPDLSFSYQPANPPTSTNMVEYFINIFEKYGVVWEVEWVGYDTSGQFMVSTVIRAKEGSFKIKNNVADFTNWSVYVTKAHYATENMVYIIDKTTKNSESPTILSTWYINNSGEITQSLVDVDLPTRPKIYLYDATSSDKPSYKEVAQSELSGSNYSHVITVDVRDNSQLVSFNDIDIGKQVSLTYDKTRYRSILTGYSLNSSSSYMTLTFGHIRNTLKSLIK
ncbi:TPA: hypothetical protein ACGO3A_002296 [Streptococcus suis]